MHPDPSRPTFAVSDVSDQDIDDLAWLRQDWHPGDDAAFLAEFRAWWAAEAPNRLAWLARDSSGQPIGMANALVFRRMPVPGRPSARWLYGANVYVVPAHRRTGVASALMTAMIDRARTEGMLRIVLAPSEMSIPFYAGLGFRAATDLMRLDL